MVVVVEMAEQIYQLNFSFPAKIILITLCLEGPAKAERGETWGKAVISEKVAMEL